MEVGERRALRADVALAERVGIVATHREHAVAFDLDRDAAGRLQRDSYGTLSWHGDVAVDLSRNGSGNR